MGHLRPVKDPFRTELAARLLPDSSRVKVFQLGAALRNEMAEQARAASASNRRYEWLGQRPREEALQVLSGCRLLSLTSKLEGGANVISEAVTLGVPVVSSHIAGSIGLLGEDYPGYFPFGETQALADLLWRAETDQGFYNVLRNHCGRRRRFVRAGTRASELAKPDSGIVARRGEGLMGPDVPHRFRLVDLDAEDLHAEFARDVLAGLTAAPKRLSCRYLYDREGSRLFEAICALPEYYLTRAEAAILRDHAQRDCRRLSRRPDSRRARQRQCRQDALATGSPWRSPAQGALCADRYLPAGPRRKCRGPARAVSGAGDRCRRSGIPRGAAAAGQPSRTARKLVLWLGSNIGNFERTEAVAFLRKVRDALHAGDRLLVGVDLRKERAILEAAYDDAAGVTAAFNRNLLARINHELDGNFDLSAFRHRAVYNVDRGRIEMYLVSTRCAARDDRPARTGGCICGRRADPHGKLVQVFPGRRWSGGRGRRADHRKVLAGRRTDGSACICSAPSARNRRSATSRRNVDGRRSFSKA